MVRSPFALWNLTDSVIVYLTMTNNAAATQTIIVSLSEAKALPNMLGRIVPTMLQAHGTYTCTVAGVPTQYVLMPDYATRKALREATLKVGR